MKNVWILAENLYYSAAFMGFFLLKSGYFITFANIQALLTNKNPSTHEK